MTDIDVRKDLDNATLTVTAVFDAPLAKVWELYSNPRKLERWWGPPGYPATFTKHEFTPGGIVNYSMTGPDGEQYPGRWDVVTVDEPHRFEVIDSFATADGEVNTDLPSSRMSFAFSEVDGRTTLESVTTYESREALQQTLDMGMEEGLKAAMGQIDALLAE